MRLAMRPSRAPAAPYFRGRSPGRHLLGDAVNVAATEQDFPRLHADDTTLRKDAAERSERLLVVSRIDQRHDDRGIRDVEIHVGPGEALADGTPRTAVDRIDVLGFPARAIQRTRLLQLVNLQTPA